MSTLQPRPARWRRAYPDELLAAERARLLTRRLRQPPPEDPNPPELQRLPPDSTGLALSGGGIRSATFALGFFQGLAKARQLNRLDFLSTVSGGSYFGAVISSLLARKDGYSIEQVEDLLPENPPADSRPLPPGKEARPAPWLRRNGYYLAPNGGDVLLAGSIWLRNWLALHLVLFFALVTGGLLLQLPWLLLARFELEALRPLSALLQAHTAPTLMISPWLDLVLVPLLLALATGWAFWLLRNQPVAAAGASLRQRLQETLREPHPALGALAAAVLAGLIVVLSLCPWLQRWLPLPQWPGLPDLALAILLVAALSGLLVLWVMGPASRDSVEPGHTYAKARNLLSRALAGLLALACLLSLIAFTDSLGLSAYASLFVQESHWAGAAAFGGVLLAALSKLLLLPKTAQDWLAAKLPEGQSLLSSLPQLSLRKLVPLIAAVLALLWLTAAVTLSHALVRDFSDPWQVPVISTEAKTETGTETAVTPKAEPAGAETQTASAEPKPADPEAAATTEAVEPAELAKPGPLAEPDATASRCPVAAPEPVCPPLPPPALLPLAPWNLWPSLFGLMLAGVFTLLFGRTWSFVNRSSYQSLYAARLTRAYVGAGNPERTRQRQPVTDPLPGDDVALADFASATVQCRGGPLHFINLTINETASANEGTVNRDRKGIGMSVGPCGFSAGVSHHALLREDASQLQALHRPVRADEADTTVRYNMFGLAWGAAGASAKPFEALSLANWTAISGAAVAPGLGHHGGLGLSFLIAFANVRLGYWWRSGSDAYQTDMAARGSRERLRRLRHWLPVHYYLSLEFAGRFPGADEPYWYLTDGGHFENLGLYELIRRRLPLVLAVDAEADPAGSFESLVGLIGKARIDFGTEIAFLDEEALKAEPFASLPAGLVGPLEHLVTGTEGEAPAPAKARMALARLHYPEGDPGWLLYVKAAFVGDEPQDLCAYRKAKESASFPHQTTGDQFFDETQWECYRKLGEHSAERLFGTGAPFHGLRLPDPPPPPPEPDPNADSAGSSNSGDSPAAAA